jgi:large conductance mechanosensitive channel
MGMLQEFREFAVKGNAMDLAVGVIIGGAFGKIVDSVVNDLIMPVIGRFTGGLDFTNLYIPLATVPAGMPQTLDAVRKAGVPVFAYGNFITILINFLILAFIVFQMVKMLNRLKSAPAAAPAPPEDVVLLREIRDALKAR